MNPHFLPDIRKTFRSIVCDLEIFLQAGRCSYRYKVQCPLGTVQRSLLYRSTMHHQRIKIRPYFIKNEVQHEQT